MYSLLLCDKTNAIVFGVLVMLDRLGSVVLVHSRGLKKNKEALTGLNAVKGLADPPNSL